MQPQKELKSTHIETVDLHSLMEILEKTKSELTRVRHELEMVQKQKVSHVSFYWRRKDVL